MSRAVRVVVAGIALAVLAMSMPSTTSRPTERAADGATGTVAAHADRPSGANGEVGLPITAGAAAREPGRQAEAAARSRPDDGAWLSRDANDLDGHDHHREGESATFTTSPEGYLVAKGRSLAGQGSEITYTVELEPPVSAELPELVRTVEAALHDPRSWANDHTLRRVADPEQARIRVLLATPDTVDALCAQVGLQTNGIFSCWNGRFAALNAHRWAEGAWAFGEDLDGYRRYLVNHEFGHGLGYGHVDCPGPGKLAPLMMQQTRDTDGCVPNGWPYPHNDGVG